MQRTALLAAVAALAMAPALAQSQQPPGQNGQQQPQMTQPDRAPDTATPGQNGQPAQMPGQNGQQVQKEPEKPAETFVRSQSPDHWLGSQLIGMSVTGPGDENIGSIDDLLVDNDGNVIAAVVGVGGFLGIGAKNVAISFEELDLSRGADGTETASLTMTKEELENAPDFERYQAPTAQAPSPGTGGTPGGTPGGTQ